MKFLALLLVFFVSLPTEGRINKEYYLVQKVEGTVKIKLPFASQWSLARAKQKIPENTLINVREGQKIQLKSLFRGSKEQVIKLFTPAVIRINQSLVRKVKTNLMTIRRMPDQMGSEETTPLQSIKDAFVKLTGMVQKTPDDARLFVKDSQYNSVSNRVKPIKIFTPVNGDYQKVRQFPDHVDVVWGQVPDSKKYKIYFWKKGELRGEPYKITSIEYLDIPVLYEGSYYLQVMSEDESWQSKVHFFHRKPFEKLKSKDRSFIEDKNLSLAEPTVELISPADNFTLLTKDKPMVEFRWDGKKALGFDTQYLLKVENIKTKKVRTYYSQSPYLTIEIPHGSYHWYVLEKHVDGNQVETFFSEKISLRVERLNQQQFFSEKHLNNLFNSSSDRVIFLDSM